MLDIIDRPFFNLSDRDINEQINNLVRSTERPDWLEIDYDHIELFNELRYEQILRN